MTVLLTEMSLGQSEKAHYQVKIKNKMKCGEQLCKVPCVCVCVSWLNYDSLPDQYL